MVERVGRGDRDQGSEENRTHNFFIISPEVQLLFLFLFFCLF